jgi:hypothetical protein
MSLVVCPEFLADPIANTLDYSLFLALPFRSATSMKSPAPGEWAITSVVSRSDLYDLFIF